MLYFSSLSVTDDKQRDRKHPFSFPQCRQGNMGLGGWGLFGVAVLGDLVLYAEGGLSLVLRTEDVWRRCNKPIHRNSGVLSQGFLTPTMQSG
jgi:hypothetical protein